MKRKVLIGLVVVGLFAFCVGGCGIAGLGSKAEDLKGSITGNSYIMDFYSNTGEKTLVVEGSNIGMDTNIVKEYVYIDGIWGYSKEVSSVITFTVDGHELESCGDTVIISEDGLEPEVDFEAVDVIGSTDNGGASPVIISKVLNKYENYFGKSRVVVIKSQLGDPIEAYSGDDVYWEVCQDLPKTTKLYIDGRALYIHRANFQIIDKALIE